MEITGRTREVFDRYNITTTEEAREAIRPFDAFDPRTATETATV
jgi:hypothetical protein